MVHEMTTAEWAEQLRLYDAWITARDALQNSKVPLAEKIELKRAAQAAHNEWRNYIWATRGKVV